MHVGEPGCVVGEDWDRFPFYKSLFEEIRSREVAEKRAVGTKRESDVRFDGLFTGREKLVCVLYSFLRSE